MAAAGDCYFCGMMWLKILDATKELDGWNVYSLPKKMNSYFFFQPLIFRRYLGFSGDIVAKKKVPHKIWAPKKVAVLVGPWEPLGARLEPTLTQRASEVSQKRSIQLPKSTIAYPQIHFKGGFQRYSTFRKKHVCPFAIHFFTPKNSHEGHLEAGATSLSQRLKVPRRLVGKPLQLQQQLRRKLEKLIRRTGQTDDGKTLFFFGFWDWFWGVDGF